MNVNGLERLNYVEIVPMLIESPMERGVIDIITRIH